MSPHMKIRITSEYVKDEMRLVEFLKKQTVNPSEMVLVEEVSEKGVKHYHAYLQDTPSPPTLRQLLKEHLKIPYESKAKHTAYSVNDKHHNWPGYIGYLFKDIEHPEFPTRIVYNEKHSPEEQRSYYASVSCKDSCVGEPKGSKGSWSRVQQFRIFIKDKHWETALDLARLVRKWYWHNQQLYNKAEMARMVQTIYYNDDDKHTILDSQILDEAEIQLCDYDLQTKCEIE